MKGHKSTHLFLYIYVRDFFFHFCYYERRDHIYLLCLLFLAVLLHFGCTLKVTRAALKKKKNPVPECTPGH